MNRNLIGRNGEIWRNGSICDMINIEDKEETGLDDRLETDETEKKRWKGRRLNTIA